MSNATTGPELTFNEAAEILGISPRATRDVMKLHTEICPCIEYGYKKKRFTLAGVLAVKAARRTAALLTARQHNAAHRPCRHTAAEHNLRQTGEARPASPARGSRRDTRAPRAVKKGGAK